MKYNLGVLNDIEFEDLCKDLLDLRLNVDLQIFKDGKDGGIDLRYSERIENEIVVQVKHYELSAFSQLIDKMHHEYEIDPEQIVSNILQSEREDYRENYKERRVISSKSQPNPWEEISRLFQRE